MMTTRKQTTDQDDALQRPRIQVGTWVALAALTLSILTGTTKFYADDQIQTDAIVQLRQQQQRADNKNDQVLQLLADIRERLARVESALIVATNQPYEP